MQIAPLGVSDAAMLAPEEIFSGKGNIKEDGELTQADRKRRRAKKKRKFKGTFSILVFYFSKKVLMKDILVIYDLSIEYESWDFDNTAHKFLVDKYTSLLLLQSSSSCRYPVQPDHLDAHSAAWLFL